MHSWTSSMQHNECKSDHCEIAVCTSFSHSLHGIMGRIHDHKAYTHQNGMCSISCDFVICLVPVWEAKVIVLNLEVQVRENELQHHSACRLSHCSDWHLECSESSVVCQLHTSGVACFAVDACWGNCVRMHVLSKVVTFFLISSQITLHNKDRSEQCIW